MHTPALNLPHIRNILWFSIKRWDYYFLFILLPPLLLFPLPLLFRFLLRVLLNQSIQPFFLLQHFRFLSFLLDSNPLPLLLPFQLPFLLFLLLLLCFLLTHFLLPLTLRDSFILFKPFNNLLLALRQHLINIHLFPILPRILFTLLSKLALLPLRHWLLLLLLPLISTKPGLTTTIFTFIEHFLDLH